MDVALCRDIVLEIVLQGQHVPKEVAELRLSLFVHAAHSTRPDRLKPFPPCFYDKITNTLRHTDLMNHIGTIPKMKDFTEFTSLPELTWQLLHWIFTNPLNIEAVTKSEISNYIIDDLKDRTKLFDIPNLDSKCVLFEITPSHPKKAFIEGKKKFGSFFAYHGSAMENFHSIIHNGLNSALNIRSVYGIGTYLSSNLSIAKQYSSVSRKRKFMSVTSATNSSQNVSATGKWVELLVNMASNRRENSLAAITVATNSLATNSLLTNILGKYSLAANSLSTNSPVTTNDQPTESLKINNTATDSLVTKNQCTNSLATNNPATDSIVTTNNQPTKSMETNNLATDSVATTTNSHTTSSSTRNWEMTNSLATNSQVTYTEATNSQVTYTEATNTPQTTNSEATNTLATNSLATNSLATNILATNSLVNNSLVTYTEATNTPQTTNSEATNTLATNSLATNILATNSLVNNSLTTTTNSLNSLTTNTLTWLTRRFVCVAIVEVVNDSLIKTFQIRAGVKYYVVNNDDHMQLRNLLVFYFDP